MKKMTVNFILSKERKPINPEDLNTLILAAGLFLLFWAAVWTFSWNAVSNFLTIFVLPAFGLIFGSRQLITGFYTEDKNARTTAILFGSVMLASAVLLIAMIVLAVIRI